MTNNIHLCIEKSGQGTLKCCKHNNFFLTSGTIGDFPFHVFGNGCVILDNHQKSMLFLKIRGEPFT